MGGVFPSPCVCVCVVCGGGCFETDPGCLLDCLCQQQQQRAAEVLLRIVIDGKCRVVCRVSCVSCLLYSTYIPGRAVAAVVVVVAQGPGPGPAR